MKVSIVSPVFNEEEIVESFIDELLEICLNLELDFEIILVDDGSRDSTWKIISQIAEKTPNLKAVRLARNYGKDTAMYTGLEQVIASEVVVILDSDLQHPPVIIKDLLTKVKAGNEIVYAVKSVRPSESSFSYYSATVFYAILALIHRNITPLKTDFMAFTNFTRISILKCENRNLPLKVAMLILNPKSSTIKYTPRDRISGSSRWTTRKRFVLGMKLLFSYSAITKPFLFSGFIFSILFCIIWGTSLFLQMLKEDLGFNQITLLCSQIFLSLIILTPGVIQALWSMKSSYFKTQVEIRQICTSRIE